MSDFFSKAEAALEYAKKGFPVFPCHYMKDSVSCSCKDGASCHSKGKHPIISGGFQNASVDEEQVRAWWRQHPNANIGMAFIGTRYFAVDVDIKVKSDGRNGFSWLASVEDHMTHTVKQVTPSGGLHFVYEAPEGVRVSNSSNTLASGVDVRGPDGYIMVEPSDHLMGGTYQWEDSIMDFKPAPADDWLLEMLGKTESHTNIRDSNGKSRYSIEMPFETEEEIRSALNFIPSHDYDTWIMIGMCLHSEYADKKGFDIWDEWSSMSDKYDYSACVSKWYSFSSGGNGSGVKTMSTLFRYAMDLGWENVGANSCQIDNLIKAQEKAGLEVEDWVQDKKLSSMPPHLIAGARVGILGDYIKYVCDSAEKPQPILAIAAGLSLFGTTFGRFFEFNNRTRPNTYILGVLESGLGKDHARTCNVEILTRTENKHLIGAEDIASGVALWGEISTNPCRLFQFDEFGEAILGKMSSTNAQSYERSINAELLKLFGSSNKSYVKGKARGMSPEVPEYVQPHASVYGTSSPANFYPHLTGTIALGGLLSRFLVFDVLPDYDMELSENLRSVKDVPVSIIDALNNLRIWQSQMRSDKSAADGNLMELTDPTTINIAFDDDAKRFFYDMEKSTMQKQKNAEHLGPLWARYREQSIKLAGIRRLCIWVKNTDISRMDLPTITIEDAIWAGEVVGWCVGRLVNVVDETMSESKSEAIIKRVLFYIRKKSTKNMENKGEPWVSNRDVTNGTRFCKASERKEAIEHLAEVGDITLVKVGKSVRIKPTVYTGSD